MSYKKRTGFNFVLVCFLLSIASLNIFAGEFTVFNKTYIRGTGSPVTIADTFNVTNPNTTWTLKAVNGSLEDDTVETVSSSTLLLNNVEVLQSNQFNQNTNLITVPVTLNSTNTISTTLKGKPGGQLAVEIVGIDDIVPLISNLTPSSGTLLNNSQPQISAQYSDDISGIDINSLVILLDGDVVSESNITPTSFDFTPNDPLNDGIHTLFVSVQDNAGNQAQATITFTTDITAPIITNVNPADGSTTSTAQPTFSANYGDATSGIDINSAKITLDGTNITSLATVTPTSISFASTTNLSEGVHTAVFEVNDLAGNSDTAQTDFTIPTSNTNTAPTIGSIGNQNVTPGSTLNFTVSASDPNNDDLTLIVVPLPLPDNASFNIGTGLFTFAPDVTQAGGSFDLTFIASDGSLTDSEVITITVNTLPTTGTTSLQGQILDANDAENGITTPIVGVVVKNIETGLSTLTDGAGNFALTGIPFGIKHFEYDGSAVTASDGSSYGAYVGNKDIIANVANVIDRPIYLMRIDTTGEAQVDPASTTVINNTNLNVTLTIPPNTVKDENGNDYTGMLSISEVPAGFTPAALPDNLGPGMVVSIQPMGLTFAQPVPIIFPNFDNLTPGSEVNLWSLNHTTGKFFVAGIGQVSPDGSVIDTLQGGIVETSWHLLLPFPAKNLDNPEDDSDRCETCESPINADCNQTKSGFITQTGNFFEDHTLSSYRSLGVSKALKFFYNSTSAYPCPIITTQTSQLPNNPVPNTISTNLKVGGINFSNETFKQGAADLVRQSSMFDATSIDTGNYPYSLETKSYYTSSTVTGGIDGNVLVNNQSNNPFGAGWTLDGLQKLHGLSRVDGRVLLTEGNGSARLFTTKIVGTGGFSSHTDFPVGNGPKSIAIGDFNGDNELDLATANLIDNNVSIQFGDGTGNFSSATNFLVGNAPISIEVGDFNGDNELDLATANEIDDNVSILLGDGTGNFSSATNFLVGNAPVSIEVGDFNGDSVLDIATANANASDTVSILVGTGTGNFSSPINFSVGIDQVSITTGDFNGDNVLDLAVVSNSNNNLSILLGDGTGNFTNLVTVLVGNRPSSVVTGDFNADNVLDLAVTNFNDSTVSILLGDGTGNFSTPTDFPVGLIFTNGPSAIVTGDFNGDNVLDLATVNSRANNVSILLGDGTGGFFFSSPYIPVGNGPESIATGDFNGDNVLDLATADSFDDTVSILLGEPVVPGGSPGDFSTFVKNEDSTLTRTLKNGTQINFDANGFHTSTIDRNANTTTYTYDP